MSFNECAAALGQKITKTVVDAIIGNIARPMIAKHLAPSPKVRVFAPDAAFRHYDVMIASRRLVTYLLTRVWP